MIKLIMLDVGHGNSAILVNGALAAIIDAPLGPTLTDALHELGISEIELVLVSHSDKDHIGGIIGLLLDPGVIIRRIFVNADATKDTNIWRDFRSAISDARKRYKTDVRIGLTTSLTGRLDIDDVNIQILAPTPELALNAAKGTDLKGRPLDSNAMSAVIRLIYKDMPFALLTGDIELTGLENLLEENDDIRSNLLVFPHHGGLPHRADPRAFASKLCEHVTPDVILFSIGRRKHNTPHPEIIEGVRKAVPEAHIICTQLSMHCAENVAGNNLEHILDLPAKGRFANYCCGGTVVLCIVNDTIKYEPDLVAHSDFIKSQVSTPLCLPYNMVSN